jgi:hypothetical protein
MNLLIDTNIFLEIILEQEQADQAQKLLSNIGRHRFYITDFSLHSIGLLLFRRNRHEAFQEFLEDMFLNAGIQLVTLSPLEMEVVIAAAKKYELDFDDAYQYAIAERYDLVIVSFDGDFDTTTRGRKIPTQVMI